MIKQLSSWALGGALVASLAWNVQSMRAQHAPVCQITNCRQTLQVAKLDLGLKASQVGDLAALCETSCNEALGLENEANRAVAELWQSLADPTFDVSQVAQRVDAINELRARSFQLCVETAVRVRESLPAEDSEQLFSTCCKPNPETTE